MYNKVIMMGRIANDLELKTTPQGVSVCTFRIAVDRRYRAKGKEGFCGNLGWITPPKRNSPNRRRDRIGDYIEHHFSERGGI